jgi:transposase
MGAGQRDESLRDVFNLLRFIAKTGSKWRFIPNDLPLWTVVHHQIRRWIEARCFEIKVEDLRIMLREFAGRKGQPTVMILDSRTLQSTLESGIRDGYDGAKRRKRSKVHAADDTLGGGRELCMRGTLPTPGQRLRAAGKNPRGAALSRIRRIRVRILGP